MAKKREFNVIKKPKSSINKAAVFLDFDKLFSDSLYLRL
jgi:hypothetical protein